MYLLLMKNFIFIIIFFLITNCTLNSVINHHGVNALEKKQKKLILNKSNKNDIVEILGPPSTKSTFNNDVWIFIERKTSTAGVHKLGKKILLINNVLVLEINDRGMLTKKDFFNKEAMRQNKINDDITLISYTKKSFIYDFLSSMRQKINDPLGKRRDN